MQTIILEVPAAELYKMREIYKNDTYNDRCFVFEREYEGDVCLEIYIWSFLFPELYKRFLITPKLKMTYVEKCLFDVACQNETIMNEDEIEKIYEIFDTNYPGMHLKKYNNPIHMLHHIYCSFQEGIQEILYKAGLGYLALYLNDIDDYNMIGTTPSGIFDGLPIKLLRVFDSEQGIVALKTEQQRANLYSLYMKKPILFGEKWSFGQCKYFEEIICKRITGEFMNEDYQILQFFQECYNEEQYKEIIRYIEIRKEIFETIKLPLLPEEGDGIDDSPFYKANFLYDNLVKGRDFMDYMLSLQYEEYGKKLEYQDDRFILRWPKDMGDICRESAYQKNCLWNYMEDIAYGETLVLFLRKADAPDCPYVTVEIMEDTIVEARARFNAKIPEEADEWLEEYAEKKNLGLVRLVR